MHFNGFPPIVDIDGLSLLLNRKPSVIHLARTRKPHTLPPACTPPETRRQLWITEDVVNWLRKYQEQPASETQKPKMGAPTKAERIAKRNSATKQ